MKKFVVRAPLDFAGLGTIVMIIVIGALVFAQVENQDIPLPIMVIFILVVIIPGFLLMVAPIKGVWDIIVDGDDITVVKAFIFKRHWKFSDISYGKVTRGGMKIYVEGGKKKAFFVDGMCEHFSNFMKRMDDEFRFHADFSDPAADFLSTAVYDDRFEADQFQKNYVLDDVSL